MRSVEDSDPVETREWLDSLTSVVQAAGRDRGLDLLGALSRHAQNLGLTAASQSFSAYRNTIPLADQARLPMRYRMGNRTGAHRPAVPARRACHAVGAGTGAVGGFGASVFSRALAGAARMVATRMRPFRVTGLWSRARRPPIRLQRGSRPCRWRESPARAASAGWSSCRRRCVSRVA